MCDEKVAELSKEAMGLSDSEDAASFKQMQEWINSSASADKIVQMLGAVQSVYDEERKSTMRLKKVNIVCGIVEACTDAENGRAVFQLPVTGGSLSPAVYQWPRRPQGPRCL